MISKWKYVWAPWAAINGLRAALRGRLFEMGVWKSVEFEMPIIYVGTLAKDDTLEVSSYICSLLGGVLHIHRYKLTSNEWTKVADAKTMYVTPLFTQESEVKACCTSHKVLGLSEWYQYEPETVAVVMDDEFALNEIRPQLRVLVTSHHRPFYEDVLSPIGHLNEPKSAASRADVVLVLGTPPLTDCHTMETEMRPYLKTDTPIFFINDLNPTSNSFNSKDKIEFIADRHNFERLILNILPNANPDSE
ncbi:tetraacyldisaccharide 4'-kinase [Reichenbachiella carrageenanivorans]|uniref:Tetraacyldisaccharide 4'-kinase n=1 Tax=Reichenbachiella carrageenanivorans TaxID=2979869 RepID=A0ABY6CZ21_9BACT|nr:tetraacyldisaccharide 4'-kinase [Reichenbachiella carrageenanivorans]UXX79167.1 tetraacyldisaccharide 4'-kinase [Reichenbachiella carrageenanivorans]